MSAKVSTAPPFCSQAAGVMCTVAPNTFLLSSTMCIPGSNCTVAACCRNQCTNLANGVACNDGNAATTADTCFNKVCRGTVACSAAGVTCPTNFMINATQRCQQTNNCNAARCCIIQMGTASLVITQPKTSTTFQGVVVVKIVDKAGKLVTGASVSGVFRRSSGKISENVNGVTATSGATAGTITLRTRATWTAYDQTLQFCVTGATKSGFLYATGLNKVTCVTVPAMKAGRAVAMQGPQ